MLRARLCLRLAPRGRGGRGGGGRGGDAKAVEYMRWAQAETIGLKRERSAIRDVLVAVEEPIVVNNLDSVVNLTATRSVSSQSLYTNACHLRANTHARAQLGSCVVGGSSAIRRIWHDYGVKPTCIFIPDDVPVPEWCLNGPTATVIVRTDAATINHEMLSSNQCDGFAAEFETPPMPSLLDLTTAPEDAPVAEAGGPSPAAFQRVIALHKNSQALNPNVHGHCTPYAADRNGFGTNTHLTSFCNIFTHLTSFWRPFHAFDFILATFSRI